VAATAALAAQAAQDSTVTVTVVGGVFMLASVVVTGIFALVKERKPEPDPSRHLPETAELAAQEMNRVDRLLTALEEARAETDLWQQRAYEAGWRL
jgi:hypothetical protein